MKKSDIIRGLKAELKDLQEVKGVSNTDYHQGKMDQLKSLIFDFNHPVGIQKLKDTVSILPSHELRILNINQGMICLIN